MPTPLNDFGPRFTSCGAIVVNSGWLTSRFMHTFVTTGERVKRDRNYPCKVLGHPAEVGRMFRLIGGVRDWFEP